MSCNLCGHDGFVDLPFHYIWRQKRFQGVQCRRCSLITLDPLPTPDEPTLLYTKDYFTSGLHGLDRLQVDYETWADRSTDSARRFLKEEILRRHPTAGSVFELGAAMGHFLAAARDLGWEVGGVEISADAVSMAREKFGLDLLCNDIESLASEEQADRWDVVYAGDLFEHLRDPSGTLAKVTTLLKPGGLCIMKVPGTFNLLATRLAVAWRRGRCGLHLRVSHDFVASLDRS